MISLPRARPVLLFFTLVAAAATLAGQQTASLALPDGPSPQAPEAPASSGPVLMGTVLAADGSPLSGVRIVLTNISSNLTRSTLQFTAITDSNGAYQIPRALAGKYTLTATLDGFALYSQSGIVLAPDHPVIQDVRLEIATVTTSVDAMTPREIAIEELHQEEHQRILAIIPNFYLSFDHNPPPLNSSQKFDLATRSFIDPTTFAFAAAAAGIEQAQGTFAGDPILNRHHHVIGYTGYGYGAEGFGKRYGAALANTITGVYLGGAIFPALLHQDPRYIKGQGTVTHRFLYALSTSFICLGDNSKWQPNYSFILGNLTTGAISNAYYPATDRGAGLTFENFGLSMASGSVGAVVQEFILAPLTTRRINKKLKLQAQSLQP